jgi:hypothetical protein
MAKVWQEPLDPRDYRAQEQKEEYEGPLFKQMMQDKAPEPEPTPRGMQGRQYDPGKHAKRNLHERSERTYYN